MEWSDAIFERNTLYCSSFEDLSELFIRSIFLIACQTSLVIVFKIKFIVMNWQVEQALNVLITILTTVTSFC